MLATLPDAATGCAPWRVRSTVSTNTIGWLGRPQPPFSIPASSNVIAATFLAACERFLLDTVLKTLSGPMGLGPLLLG